MVFEYIVLGQFNMDLIEPAAESLFLLICCHQDEYLKLANNLIAKQQVTDETFKERLIDAFQVFLFELPYWLTLYTQILFCFPLPKFNNNN